VERFGLDFGTTNSSLTWARGEGLPQLCDLDPPAPDPRVLRTLLYFSLEGNSAFFLFEEIERAKARLSTEEEAAIRFHVDAIDVEERLTRVEFEALIAADIATVGRCMRDVLSRAGLSAADVESVFVTGGSAQIPALRALLAAEFGVERLRAEDYLTTVACGLGLSAARWGRTE